MMYYTPVVATTYNFKAKKTSLSLIRNEVLTLGEVHKVLRASR